MNDRESEREQQVNLWPVFCELNRWFKEQPKRAKDVPEKPSWLKWSPEDPLNLWYQRVPVFLEKGSIALGHVIQANEKLWHRGRQDHPLVVIYTFDPFYYRDADCLEELAYELFMTKAYEEEIDEEDDKAEVGRVLLNLSLIHI